MSLLLSFLPLLVDPSRSVAGGFARRRITADLSSLPTSTQCMLEYFHTQIANNEATRQIDSEVEDARQHEEWREEYMLTVVHDNDVYNDGFGSGFDSGFGSGFDSGIQNEIFSSIQEGDYSIERGAEKLRISADELERRMLEAGFKVPISK